MRQELLALVKELPSLLSEIGAGASALTEGIELYEACVEFVCERWARGHDARGCLPVGPCWDGGCRGLPALHLTLKSLRRPPARQSRCCPCCGTWGGEATPPCTSGGRGSSPCAWSGRRCRRCRSSRRRTRCVRPCAAAAGWGGRQRPAGICLSPASRCLPAAPDPAAREQRQDRGCLVARGRGGLWGCGAAAASRNGGGSQLGRGRTARGGSGRCGGAQGVVVLATDRLGRLHAGAEWDK